MNSTWEHTFALIKPDGVQRALIGKIISRFEQTGLTVTAMKMMQVSRKLAEEHYREHQGKSFYEPLVNLLLRGPVVALRLEGAHAISVVRKIVGATEPLEAAPGSIRGDFCHMGYARSKERLGVIPNLVHASDSKESALRELTFWFNENDEPGECSRTDSAYM